MATFIDKDGSERSFREKANYAMGTAWAMTWGVSYVTAFYAINMSANFLSKNIGAVFAKASKFIRFSFDSEDSNTAVSVGRNIAKSYSYLSDMTPLLGENSLIVTDFKDLAEVFHKNNGFQKDIDAYFEKIMSSAGESLQKQSSHRDLYVNLARMNRAGKLSDPLKNLYTSLTENSRNQELIGTHADVVANKGEGRINILLVEKMQRGGIWWEELKLTFGLENKHPMLWNLLDKFDAASNMFSKISDIWAGGGLRYKNFKAITSGDPQQIASFSSITFTSATGFPISAHSSHDYDPSPCANWFLQSDTKILNYFSKFASEQKYAYENNLELKFAVSSTRKTMGKTIRDENGHTAHFEGNEGKIKAKEYYGPEGLDQGKLFVAYMDYIEYGLNGHTSSRDFEKTDQFVEDKETKKRKKILEKFGGSVATPVDAFADLERYLYLGAIGGDHTLEKLKEIKPADRTPNHSLLVLQDIPRGNIGRILSEDGTPSMKPEELIFPSKTRDTRELELGAGLKLMNGVDNPAIDIKMWERAGVLDDHFPVDYMLYTGGDGNGRGSVGTELAKKLHVQRAAAESRVQNAATKPNNTATIDDLSHQELRKTAAKAVNVSGRKVTGLDKAKKYGKMALAGTIFLLTIGFCGKKSFDVATPVTNGIKNLFGVAADSTKQKAAESTSAIDSIRLRQTIYEDSLRAAVVPIKEDTIISIAPDTLLKEIKVTPAPAPIKAKEEKEEEILKTEPRNKLYDNPNTPQEERMTIITKFRAKSGRVITAQPAHPAVSFNMTTNVSAGHGMAIG